MENQNDNEAVRGYSSNFSLGSQNKELEQGGSSVETRETETLQEESAEADTIKKEEAPSPNEASTNTYAETTKSTEAANNFSETPNIVSEMSKNPQEQKNFNDEENNSEEPKSSQQLNDKPELKLKEEQVDAPEELKNSQEELNSPQEVNSTPEKLKEEQTNAPQDLKTSQELETPAELEPVQEPNNLPVDLKNDKKNWRPGFRGTDAVPSNNFLSPKNSPLQSPLQSPRNSPPSTPLTSSTGLATEVVETPVESDKVFVRCQIAKAAKAVPQGDDEDVSEIAKAPNLDLWKRKTTTAVRWVEDEDALECLNCKAPFNFFTRKHHCRHCGKIFCGSCVVLGNLEFMGFPDPEKTCLICMHTFQISPL